MTDNVKHFKPRVIKNKNTFTSDVINNFTEAVTAKDIVGVASVVIYKNDQKMYLLKESTTAEATSRLITALELLKLDIINTWIKPI